MNKTLVTIKSPALLLGSLIALVGPANVLDAATRRDKKEVLVVASIDSAKIDGNGKLAGLPSGASLKSHGQIGETVQQLDLDRTKWARIGTVERQNGFYAVTADAGFQNTPSFGEIMDQVKKKKVQTFDTAFAHQGAPMATWIGKRNCDPRQAYLAAREIRAARFDTLGLYLTADESKDLVLFPYGKLDSWLRGTSQNIEDADSVFEAKRHIYSLSHINGGKLVVNQDRGHKTTIDLSPLSDDLGVKVVGSDEQDDTCNFVGFRENATGTVAFVDYTKQTIRFTPTAKLTGALRQYAQESAAA